MKQLSSKSDLPLGIQLYLIVDDAVKYVQDRINKKYKLERKSFLYIVFAEYDIGLKQDKLASYIGTDKSTAGRAIEKLVKQDLLIRKQDPNNRRANQIYTTDKGAELNHEILELIHEWKEKATLTLSAKTIKETAKFIDAVLAEKIEGDTN